jgi:hypothetical protein
MDIDVPSLRRSPGWWFFPTCYSPWLVAFCWTLFVLFTYEAFKFIFRITSLVSWFQVCVSNQKLIDSFQVEFDLFGHSRTYFWTSRSLTTVVHVSELSLQYQMPRKVGAAAMLRAKQICVTAE